MTECILCLVFKVGSTNLAKFLGLLYSRNCFACHFSNLKFIPVCLIEYVHLFIILTRSTSYRSYPLSTQEA